MLPLRGERALTALASIMDGRRGHQAFLRRTVLTLVCILAFSLQSYVAQTHIHIPSLETTKLTVSQAGHDSKQPVPSDDPVRCPQCQVAHLAGAAVAPDALVFIIPSHSFFSGYLADTALLIKDAVTYAWGIRGPPAH
jgi:hypothetical protein